MRVITVRNVQEALPTALVLLSAYGVQRDSRNGPVKLVTEPVATVYTNPTERVLFWGERDANPFFHLYESLWMLAGRNDIEPLTRYVKRIADYSDDGVTLNDAYGHRWRKYFLRDQLSIIVRRLREDPNDRRSILQMWDAYHDLDYSSKALPCKIGRA